MKKLKILILLLSPVITYAQCDLDLSYTFSNYTSCAGGDGSVTVYPQGGSGNYSYAWAPSGNTQTINWLNPGVYQVTVTDNTTMCTGTTSVEVLDGCVVGGSTCAVTASSDTSVCLGYNFTYLDGTVSSNVQVNESHTSTLSGQGVGGCDSIVTQYVSILSNSTGTDVITACGSYNWIDGNTYTASNNTATYILTNQAGCDSTVTLNLIINPLPDNNVTQTDVTLSANQASAQYQWLDCDNSYSQINGETNQTYTSGVTGNYAVEVTVNGCADSSACFLVDYSGIENLISEQIQIYPNPTNDGIMFINYDGQINAIEVMDMTGRKVSSSVVIENKTIDASKLSMGNYMIHVTTNEGVVVKEVTIIR